MGITEEQHIDFIISKIDILLEDFRDLNIKDALSEILTSHLTEAERKAFVLYFYKLHKGYSKYKHINLMIDYHKNIERLAVAGYGTPSPSAKDSVISELEDEISDIEEINKAEMVKLKSFFLKIIVFLLISGVAIYIFMLAFLSNDQSEIILGIAKLF